MLSNIRKLVKVEKYYSLPTVTDNLLLSSAFNSEYVKAYINNIKVKYANKNTLFESDFSAMLAAILPYYFKLKGGWVIAAEIWSNDKYRSDFVVFLPYILPGNPSKYGQPIPRLMCESKYPSAVPWKDLVKEQLWNKANSVSEDYKGKLWVIGQIGFYVCIFRFDVTDYYYSDWFTNFSPLNLRNLNEHDLDYLEVQFITESISNHIDVIQVIQWDLREKAHHEYINEMLEHIATNNQ